MRNPQSSSKKYCEYEAELKRSSIRSVGMRLDGESGVQAGPDCVALVGLELYIPDWQTQEIHLPLLLE